MCVAASAAAVLAVTLAGAGGTPAAKAGLPPVHNYQITIQQWVPQAEFADRYMPLPVPYQRTKVPSDLAPVDPNCLPESKELEQTQVTSVYLGNGHRGFAGGFWLREVISFRFDGAISKFRVVAKNTGPWTRKKTYTRDGTIVANCQAVKNGPIAGDAKKTAFNKFEMAMSTLNPLSAAPILFQSQVSGTVEPSGDIKLKLDLDAFPSSGIIVKDNGQTILSDIAVDASCVSKAVVTGYQGVGLFEYAAYNQDTTAVTASPAAPVTTSHPSPLCHRGTGSQSARGGAAKPAGLSGELLTTTKGIGGSTARCRGKSGTFSFTTAGRADGPYQGTFTETGRIRLRKYRIAAFTTSARITTKRGKITVTETLARPASDDAFCLTGYGFAGLKGTFRATGTIDGHPWSDSGAAVLGVTGGAAKASFIRQALK
jgi:hypothetical protein